MPLGEQLLAPYEARQVGMGSLLAASPLAGLNREPRVARVERAPPLHYGTLV
ncbi:MAG: hypothetical protein ACRD1A_12125 [Terriglobales bacterium]